MAKAMLEIVFTGYKRMRMILKRKRVVLAAVDFPFDKNLDTLLIVNLDKLLKQTRIDPLSLTEVSVRGDVDKNSSAYKIAKSFAVALAAEGA